MMVDGQPHPNANSMDRMTLWLRQNRARLQALTLVGALGAPFGLYWALQSGRDGAAVAFFAVTVASLIAVIIAG